MADKMSIEKKDLSKDDSGDESTGSSAEAEAQQNNNNAPQENQQPKRKGGRKPIYATSEERKQRNRQAQAAFRERRTEYIKQLEETIRVHEQNLHNLQTAHRHAADECLMLRYKNSLLERILLEKGIDVQAELRAKTGSPTLGPTHMPQNMVQPPPIQRALLNRHHARRSNSSIAPKLEPGVVAGPLPPPLQSPHALTTGASPKNRPTPPSHTASPTATSYSSQHGASPATSGSDHMTGQVRHPHPPTNSINSMKAPPVPVGGLAAAGAAAAAAAARQMHMARAQQTAADAPQVSGGVNAAPFYATQAYQNHIEQLGKLTPFFSPPPPLQQNSVVLDSSRVSEQEYDAAADMMDDPSDPPDTPSGPGPYPGAQYGGEPQPMALPSPVTTMPPTNQHMAGQTPMDGVQHQQHHQQAHHHQQQQHQQQQQQQHQQQHQQHQQHQQQQQGGGYPSMTQLLDPALDWDPFGLSASMAFPAQFSFDTSNMR